MSRFTNEQEKNNFYYHLKKVTPFNTRRRIVACPSDGEKIANANEVNSLIRSVIRIVRIQDEFEIVSLNKVQ